MGAVKTYWGSWRTRQCETHLPRSQVQKQPLEKHPFFMWEVCLLILKPWPEGQGLVGIKDGACWAPPSLSPFALLKLERITFPFSCMSSIIFTPLPCSRVPVSPRGELLGSMISKPGQMNLPNQSRKKKKIEKKLYCLRDLWDNIKQTHIHITGVLEKERNRKLIWRSNGQKLS